MNDLRDLDWQAHPKPQGQSSTVQTNANYNPIYQRQNNPFAQSNAAKVAAPAAQISTNRSTTSADLFGGLVDFGGKKSEKMTMAQQAALMQAQRAASTAPYEHQFSNATFFDQQLSRPSSATPQMLSQASQSDPPFLPTQLKRKETETDEDILAQINGNAPVDRSSYYPPPASPTRIPQPQTLTGAFANAAPRQDAQQLTDDDFLGIFENVHLSTGNTPIAPQNGFSSHDDFDILGDLAKPVSQVSVQPTLTARDDLPPPFSKPRPRTPPSSSSSDDSSDDEDLRRAKAESLNFPGERKGGKEKEGAGDPRGPFIRQIVEMGFSARQAQVALAQTESGIDVTAAMELLLSLQGGVIDPPQRLVSSSSRVTTRQPLEVSVRTGAERRDGQVQNEAGDWVDSTYDLASKTLASANNWFSNKSALARRKLAEFNATSAAATHESRFDERPKWMRDAERFERKEKGKSKAQGTEDENMREEGLPMHPAERKRLEMNGVLPAQEHSRRGSIESFKSAKSITGSLRSIPDSIRSISTNITGQQTVKPLPSIAHASESFRFKANDDEGASYVSSRRRRPAQNEVKTSQAALLDSRATPGSSNGAVRIDTSNAEEEDLFGNPAPRANKGKGKAKEPFVDNSAAIPSSRSVRGSAQPIEEEEEEVNLFSPPKPRFKAETVSAARSNPNQQKSSQIRRELPYLDSTILAKASQHRTRGSEAFKRGDFAKALGYYDSALACLPQKHPIRILSLSNRAITHIHTGAPKSAIVDCEEALALIGPQRGIGETIDDSGKQIEMSNLWAKAMNRKATALEMQERTGDALNIWQELVRSGLGGPQAMEARQRCEKLAAPKIPQASARTPSRPVRPSQASKTAVQKLRIENARAAEDEATKDALYSVVETRINGWSAGKEQNLRALLSSLDQVLWPTSGWKKVTLADLVINTKVKIIYMKALAKVHPDKISRDAGIEEKMIAAGVFAKLNSAWDAFKSTNNM